MYPMMMPPPPPPPIIMGGKTGNPIAILLLICIVIGVAGGAAYYFLIFKCRGEDGECTTTSDCCENLTCIGSKCKKEITTSSVISNCGEWDDQENSSCWPEGYSVPSGFRNRDGNTIEECCRGSCGEWFSDGNTCVSKVPMPGETPGYSEGECCEEGMWYRGEAGKSCNEVCNTLTTSTKYCHPDNDITSEERLKEVMSSINFNSSQCGEFIDTRYPMESNILRDWSDTDDTNYDEDEPSRLSYNTTTSECKYINPDILNTLQNTNAGDLDDADSTEYLTSHGWDSAYCSLELPLESLFCNCRDTKPIIGEGLIRNGGPGTRAVSPLYGALSGDVADDHSRVNEGYLHGYDYNYLTAQGYKSISTAFSDDLSIRLPELPDSAFPDEDSQKINLEKAKRTYESVEYECAEGSVMALNLSNDGSGYRCEAITTCTEWFGEEDNPVDECPDELPTRSPGATLGRTITECCGL
jgi:hypothetical protein